ncbi:NPL-like protein, partial [Mya arenaria]
IKTFKLEGLIPATFTPMTADGEVDYDKYETYCQYLVDRGITQIYVNGTTGEGFSLTLEERKKVVETWINVGKKTGKIKQIVVQVGALNLHDTIAMVQHAKKVGADAIATVPPLFYKPKTIDNLIKYCREVANAAPELPFYFYHLPSLTGVEQLVRNGMSFIKGDGANEQLVREVCQASIHEHMDEEGDAQNQENLHARLQEHPVPANVEDFLKAASAEIPSLVGVKFSSKDLVDMLGCVHVPAPHRDDGKYNLVFGTDEKLMAAMVLGADGSVGSLCNFMAPLMNRILTNTAAGRILEAREDQYRAQQMCRVMYKYGTKTRKVGSEVASDMFGSNVAALKAIMAMVGLDLGGPRSPMRNGTPDELEAYRKELDGMGFFQWYK